MLSQHAYFPSRATIRTLITHHWAWKLLSSAQHNTVCDSSCQLSKHLVRGYDRPCSILEEPLSENSERHVQSLLLREKQSKKAWNVHCTEEGFAHRPSLSFPCPGYSPVHMDGGFCALERMIWKYTHMHADTHTNTQTHSISLTHTHTSFPTWGSDDAGPYCF